MRPFNLDEYLKNPNLKVITRDVRKVRIVCTDCHQVHYPVIGLVSDCDIKEESVVNFTENGQSNLHNSKTDLFFAPKNRGRWINIYIADGTYVGSTVYDSKESAEKDGIETMRDFYITTIKVTWEE